MDRFQSGAFPASRMRRLRYHPVIRNMVREVRLAAEQLILPLFVRDTDRGRRPIETMPGHAQLGYDDLAREVEALRELGVSAVLLFGIPREKDAVGSDSYREDGVVQKAIRVAKGVDPDLLVVTDVCFCEYTDHGHCGVVCDRAGRADVDNDQTLPLLGRQALSHAQAGADMVAPSGMMDGMVGAIRTHLDEGGFGHVPVMSYAAKYASAFYGPFRDAAESAPQFGDRRTYQMDPAVAADQALREMQLDLNEGADILMVKPALAYLDILRTARTQFAGVPLAAYNVSGEYSMTKAAAQRGWIDEKAVVLETLTAIRRAGADIILTYWAKDVARWLQDEG